MTQAARVVPVEQVTWNAGTSFESARPGKKAAGRGIQPDRKSEQFRLKDFLSTGSTFSRAAQNDDRSGAERCHPERCLESKVQQKALLRQHGPGKATRNMRKTMHKH